MDYKKKIESVLRAILYPQSKICVVCNNEKDSRRTFKELQYFIEQYNILEPEISDVSDYKVRFKNGSNISVLTSKQQDDTIRGRRGNISHWIYDYDGVPLNKDEFDKIIKPFCK